MLDGNAAAAEAIKLARVEVVASYPITPQSPLVERLSQMADTGEADCTYVCMESEHSAISYCIGSQLTGVRAGTATSSVGLALMHEVLGVAAGCRVPIVMPVVNRALVSPWSLWCDHQDTMAERDTGWIQFYAENAQEVLDLMILAYRIAEHNEVLLPVMVCMDGFFVSHSLQPVVVPDQTQIDEFIGEYIPHNMHLNFNRPYFINNLTPPEEFTEMRFQQEQGFARAEQVIGQVADLYLHKFGRSYGLLEAYKCENAEYIIVCLGSMAGTIKHVVNEKTAAGERIGVVKVISFRPFPHEQLSELLDSPNLAGIAVIDRSAGLGAAVGPLCLEVKATVKRNAIPVTNFVCGLGGRDISTGTVLNILDEMKKNGSQSRKVWIDVKEHAMEIRSKGDRQ